MSGQAGRYQRSVAGMVGALLVTVLLIVAFVTFRDLIREPPQNPVGAVAYRQTARYARQQADFRVLAPPRLPRGWKATSVEFTPQPPRWHLGALTDEGRYVGLEQATRSVRSMVGEYVDPAAVRDGSVRVDGRVWRTWTDADNDTALVRRDAGATTLVVGRVGRSVLVTYVDRLR